MDRTELKSILRQENSSSLNSLPYDFYEKVDEYIRELEEEIKKINNPRSVESKILEDEMQSALNDVETIFIRRIRKITSRATSNAFSNISSRQDLDKLLESERKVFEATLSAIQIARSELLEPIMNPQDRQDKGFAKESIISEKADEEEKNGTISQELPAEEETGKNNISKEYFVVRILKDLPTIKAMDNLNYTLAAEDVVVLPSMNAQGLVKRGAAYPINQE
jgi:DNA replication factor GINS